MKNDNTTVEKMPGRSLNRASGPLAEIKKLHSEILTAVRMSIDKAIRIGELLAHIKSELNHGEWLPWLEKNISFSARTARRYLQCFENRDRLKSATLSDLTDAYSLLAAPDDPARFIPSWAKKEYGVEEMNNAVEILGYALDAAARQGAEVSMKDRIVFVCLLLEKRLRLTTDLVCERFDGEKWHHLTSSLDGEGTIN